MGKGNSSGDISVLAFEDLGEMWGKSPNLSSLSAANLRWHERRAMRPLRWMSIAAVDGTCVLMGEDHKTMMILGFSTDALMDVVNNVDVFDDVEVDGADG